jgi:hypothetical protein
MNSEIVLSEPQAYFLNSTKARKLFLAGSGSGKSHGGGIESAEFIVNMPNIRGFIGANTYGQLTMSTLDRIFKVWLETFGWVNDVHYVVDKIPPNNWKRYGPKLKTYKNTICFNNGCLIFTRSLDNYMAIDGSEFGWAILDETKDTPEQAVKEVITFRLRQPGMWVNGAGKLVTKRPINDPDSRSYNPLIVLTSPAKVEWLNDWFELSDHYEAIEAKIFDKEDFFVLETRDVTVVISSTFHNSHNLPDGWVEQKLRELKASPELIKANIYGSPVAKSGGEFITTFERLKHVSKTPLHFTKGAALHLSFDFNVSPFMTGLVFEVDMNRQTGKTVVKLVRENCLENPRNNTEDVCKAVESEFGSKMNGLFFYGDPSGRNRQTVSKEFRDNFDVVEKTLRKYIYNAGDRVQKRAPDILKSRGFLRDLFLGEKYPNIQIIIDPSCKNTIRDLEFAKEGRNGEMLKPTVTVNGKTFEKYGHCLDALRYFLVSLFEDLYLDS